MKNPKKLWKERRTKGYMRQVAMDMDMDMDIRISMYGVRNAM